MDGFNFFKGNILIGGDNTCEIDSLAVKLLGSDVPDYVKISKRIGVTNN